MKVGKNKKKSDAFAPDFNLKLYNVSTLQLLGS